MPTATSRTSIANFVPIRDTQFDWEKPVDGSNPATEWKGLHTVDGQPASAESAERLAVQHEQLALLRRGPVQPEASADYPAYMDRRHREPARHPRAFACSPASKDFTLQSLIDAAYDSYLTGVRRSHPGARRGVRRDAGVRIR